MHRILVIGGPERADWLSDLKSQKTWQVQRAPSVDAAMVQLLVPPAPHAILWVLSESPENLFKFLEATQAPSQVIAVSASPSSVVWKAARLASTCLPQDVIQELHRIWAHGDSIAQSKVEGHKSGPIGPTGDSGLANEANPNESGVVAKAGSSVDRNPKSSTHKSKDPKDAVAEVKGGSKPAEKELPSSAFQKIEMELIENLQTLPTDVYVRLSDTKHVKVFRRGAQFSPASLAEYQAKRKIDSLYVLAREVKEFVSSLREQLQKSEGQEILPPELARRYHQATHETVIEIGKRMGFNSDLQKIAMSNVRSIVRNLSEKKNLQDLLASLTAEEKREVRYHSLVMAHMSCSLAAKLGWESSLTFQKLTAACLFHDLEIDAKDVDTYANLSKIREIKNRHDGPTGISAAQWRQYLGHPERAAEKLAKFQELPPQVSTIIREHHELPNGEGFPEHLKWHEISPLGALFIVTHELFNFLFEGKNERTIKDFIRVRGDIFKNGDFAKILQVLIDEAEQKPSGGASGTAA